MPREDFIKLCQEVVQSSEEDFRKLFRHVALSVYWRQEYQAVSPTSMALSQISFLALFAKGILYRSEEPSLWDPVDRTALAQAEVEEKDQQGVMYHIPFGIEGSAETITIATTRPELLGACVAVMYHPESPLAAQLEGKKAITPLFGALVPFVADEKVDPEKGTGIVMCCTFGDPTDMDWWRIHKLALRDVVNKNGNLGNFEHMGSPEWPVVDAPKAQSIVAQIQGQHVRPPP